MRGKEGKTLKKDTSHTIKRAQRFPVILIGEGLLVGAVGGLLVLLYRVALTYAGKWLDIVLKYIRGNPVRIAGWFVILLLMALSLIHILSSRSTGAAILMSAFRRAILKQPRVSIF